MSAAIKRPWSARPDHERCIADRKPLRDGSRARCMRPAVPGSRYCQIHQPKERAARGEEVKS